MSTVHAEDGQAADMVMRQAMRTFLAPAAGQAAMAYMSWSITVWNRHSAGYSTGQLVQSRMISLSPYMQDLAVTGHGAVPPDRIGTTALTSASSAGAAVHISIWPCDR